MTIVTISAGLSTPSSTRLLADRLSTAAALALRERGVEAEIIHIELRDFATDIINAMLTGFASARLDEAQRQVQDADALIVVTPVFSASYSGLFKSFFDVLDPDALVGKPVLAGATGGTARHSLALEFAVRPLFAYLRAVMLPTAVFAATEDFADGALATRITRAADEFAETLAARPVTAHPVAPLSFEQLLGARAS